VLWYTRSMYVTVISWIRSFFLWYTNGPNDVWSRTVVVWKPLGLTPLESVQQFRKEGVYVYGKKMQIPENVPIAYAGRLDPMAEGKLLLLMGEECKKIALYRERDKTYVVEILLGVSTDTGDLLGLAKKVNSGQLAVNSLDSNSWQNILKQFIGTHEWEYPVFSSRTVQGKPLFKWFYEGRIGDIVIPKRKMTVYNLQFTGVKSIASQELLKQVEARISRVTKVVGIDKEWGNDFRREEVLAAWRSRIEGLPPSSAPFTLITIVCRCGSGTYMRTLAEKMGEAMGVPACAFSITRTHI
jgi:tRNA pseudouridine(55) synthase